MARSNIVDRKVQPLPERIDSLLSDVELLSRAGFFSQDVREEAGHEVRRYSKIYGVEDLDEIPFIRERSRLSGEETVPERFGQRLGHFATAFPLVPAVEPFGTGDSDAVKLDLVVGFINAVFGVNVSRSSAISDLQNLSDLIDAEMEAQERFDEMIADGFVPESISERHEAIEEHLEQVLENNGIDPVDPVVRDVISALGGSSELYGKVAESSGSSAPEEWDPSDAVSEQEILEIVEANRLVEKQHLREQLKCDLDELPGTTFSDLPATEVIIHADADVKTVEELAESVTEGYPGVNRRAEVLPAVGVHGKYLSGEHHSTLGTRDRPAVFQLDSSPADVRDWTLQLTQYGSALNHLLPRSTAGALRPLSVVPDDVISTALDEL
ncbi:hypothetical protein L593_06030 [Salinarchaeum sp. Harcht-Bsk1]|nr:hypothetical protein L593_06030 [Salinarchaeum sp. Harcht-Bsk1]